MTDQVVPTVSKATPEDIAAAGGLTKIPTTLKKIVARAPVPLPKAQQAAPKPAPVLVTPKLAAPATQPAPEPAPEPAVTVSDFKAVIMTIVSSMADGEAVTINRTGDGQYTVSKGAAGALPAVAATKSGKPRKGKAWEQAVFTVEYINFMDVDCGIEALDEKGNKITKGFRALTRDEKYGYAQQVQASWPQNPDANIDQMRMTEGVLNALGINKYKPEYQTLDSRRKVAQG